MRAYRGRRDIILLILNLGTGWWWVVKFMLQPLCLLLITPYSLCFRLGRSRNDMNFLEKRKIS